MQKGQIISKKEKRIKKLEIYFFKKYPFIYTQFVNVRHDSKMYRYLKEKKLFIGKSKAITYININSIHINVQLYYCMTEECI